MRLETAVLVASAGLFFACASPDDDSWQGAADDELGEGAGGSGGAPSTTKGATTVTSTTATHATSVTSATTGVTSTTSAVTTGGGCDNASCEDCQTCALNGGPCAGTVDACLADTECNALVECLNTCLDDPCFNACFNDHPAAMSLFNAVGECVFCVACPSTCGGC